MIRPEVREAYRHLVARGRTNALREIHPDEQIYTFLERLRPRSGPADRSSAVQHFDRSSLDSAGVDREVRGWEENQRSCTDIGLIGRRDPIAISRHRLMEKRLP
jgi:exodeoxyribonuclease III